MKTITFESVYNALKRMGHTIFETDTHPYNLNIVGIRSDSPVPNTFNDHIAIFWKILISGAAVNKPFLFRLGAV